MSLFQEEYIFSLNNLSYIWSSVKKKQHINIGIYTNIHKINKTFHCGLGILEFKSDKMSNKFFNCLYALI